MKHFSTYTEAIAEARRMATASRIDVAIRRASRFDAPGFVVAYASRNDSDYTLAEIVRPGTP